MKRRRVLHFLPLLTILAMLGPVLAGLWGAVLPAFGYLPAAGLNGPSLEVFRALFDWPGLQRAVSLSLVTGAISTVMALSFVMLFVAGWSGTRAFAILERLLSPLLAVPHAAAAFGIAFLIAPSGWIARVFSPWLTGWTKPLDLLIVNDPAGLVLIAGMVTKEIPFLLLMTIAAMSQIPVKQSMQVSQALGYGRLSGWLKTVFPLVYAQVRLPVYVVLAYAMSVVDVAIILGPTTPATLSVQIVRWMGEPDIAQRALAAAGAMLQLSLVVGALMAWRIGENIVSRVGHRWVNAGGRGQADRLVSVVSLVAMSIAATAVIGGIAVLGAWSFAGFWSFPNIAPDQFTLRSWVRHGDGVAEAFSETLLIAVTATFAALVLTLGCLEAEARHRFRIGRAGTWLLYLPLLIPQTAFLPGLQTLMISLGAEVGRGPVVIAHLVFVLPYVYLSLTDPFHAVDPRFAQTAAALGASPDGVLWRVRLPMLLRPLLTAVAVGVAVSVGQYLPTLLIGGGRVSTLTTEALALASGGDRRAIGVFGLIQTAAALVPFVLALLIPAIVWRNRRGLLHG